jgi:predicted nucleic acid-binding protein
VRCRAAPSRAPKIGASASWSPWGAWRNSGAVVDQPGRIELVANGVARSTCCVRFVWLPVMPLARNLWALRGALTACDAAYLGLARTLDARVLTTDRRLAAAAERDRRLGEL